MLRVFSLAGKTLATFSAEEVEGKTVKSLKTLVGKQIGVTRFRQKWLAEDQSELPDDAVVPCSDVQLVVLNFAQDDAGEVEKLVQASCMNDVDKVDELLRKPLDPNQEALGAVLCPLIRKPLHLAADNGCAEVVTLLLEAGADKDAAVLGRMGRMTALHLAAQKGHSEVVKLLLEAGADKDATSFAGMTALHLATENGCTDVVKLLLAAGADQDLADSREKKPIDRAIRLGNHEITKLLESEHRTKRQKV